jgi:hypothetical protein
VQVQIPYQSACELYAGNKRAGGGTPMKTIEFLKFWEVRQAD